ncbi:hypothetical protein [Sandaracinus amylolyticus]|uniref:hypothetical protein n=1 Tax=Sandaracinus amylolyticus TaxID=927083 RepID=UPI001F32736F|nr:hypothetical protein [Sandaracinus amylolyticus]
MPQRWPAGVRKGATVLAETSRGFWLRASVLSVDDDEVRVRFGISEGAEWLPTLVGFGDTFETITPERVASLPDVAPGVLPVEGSPVVVLWDRKRFHPGVLVRRASDRDGVVRYDEGDEHAVIASDVLPRGRVDVEAAERLRAAGWREGVSVRADGHDGWIAAVGSRALFVRYARASHGVWHPPDQLALGGAARPPEPPRSRGLVAEPGARVIARWVDRVHYLGAVRAVEGSSVEVAWDDGSVEWVPAARVVVTESAPPSIPQASSVELPTFAEGADVLVLAVSGEWTRGRVVAVRGADVCVEHGRVRSWARGKHLAAAPLASLLPARGPHVVVEMREGRGKRAHVVYRAGRVTGAIANRAEVRVADAGTSLIDAASSWRRGGAPIASAVPSGLEHGTRVLVERLPGDRVRGRVLKIRADEGVARVELEGHGRATVDLARVHPVPEIDAPRPAPPRSEPPAVPEPSDDEGARRLLRLVALAWTGGGYRDLAIDGRTVALDVDAGELSCEVRVDGDTFVVELTAARAIDDAPPVDGVSVRLARFFRSMLGGRAEDVDAIAAADHAWASGIARAATVARAGGALTLVVRSDDEPSVASIVAWARAVHARLFE